MWRLRRCTNAVSSFIRFHPFFSNLKNVSGKLGRIYLKRPIATKIAAFSTLYGMSMLSSSEASLKEKLKEADFLYDENKCAEIVNLLEPLKNIKDAEVLWRLCRAKYTVAKDITDAKRKKEIVFEANDLIKEALSINEKNPYVHKWMAIMIDSTSAYCSIKEKIMQAHVMKQHMLKAVELNPKDATVHHLLGCWCFEVAAMPWYQRKVASTIFAAPPNSSFEEALEHFLKAEEVDPHFYSMNYVMLGKTYLKMNNREKAIHYLNLACDYQQKTTDDAQAKEEAITLLKNI